jgi:chemotaxis signal transduction protein
MHDKLESEKEAIFLERANRLAQPIIKLEENREEMILVFCIGQEKYAIEMQNVIRILEKRKVTPFPFFPPIFSGLLYYDGTLFPVIVPKNVLQSESESESVSCHIILIQCFEKSIAFPVDEIIGRFPYKKEKKLVQLYVNKQKHRSIVDGVYDRDISVISMKKLFEIMAQIKLVDFKGE